MSEDSRDASVRRATDDGSRRAASEQCLTRLREAVEKALAALERVEPLSQVQDLLRVQASLFDRYIRLQTAERTLSGAVARRRRSFSPLRQVERERQRLGRELHTDVGQLLTSIHLQVELISLLYPESNPGLHKALGRIAALSSEAIERVRSISKRLHPPAWLGLTLESAIRQLWDLSGIAQRFDARLNIEALERQPSLDAKVLLYRAAQEAVSNAIRHSGATRVRASLEARGNSVVLCFEDNGVGFNAQQLFGAADLASGIGLRAIREQAEALGGTLRIESGAGGAQLEVSVPFGEELG
jgi:signal transduction histidine kinase